MWPCAFFLFFLIDIVGFFILWKSWYYLWLGRNCFSVGSLISRVVLKLFPSLVAKAEITFFMCCVANNPKCLSSLFLGMFKIVHSTFNLSFCLVVIRLDLFTFKPLCFWNSVLWMKWGFRIDLIVCGMSCFSNEILEYFIIWAIYIFANC